MPSPSKSSRRVFLGQAAAAGGAVVASAALPFTDALAEVGKQRVNIVNTRGMATITVQELMKRRRHLEELGIEPNILYVVDASRLMGSLLSGESDICMFSGIGTVLTAIEKGARIKIVAGSLIKPEHAIYTKRPEIKSLADLKGKTLGAGSTGALLHTMWVAILRKYGLDERTVKFANIGSTSDVFRAVAAGVVDAGIAEIDVYHQQAKFGVHVIQEGELWTELPGFTFQGAYASEKAIKEKRDVIVRTLAAYARLYRFLSTPQSKDEFVAAQLAVSARPDAGSAAWQWQFFQEQQIYAADLTLSEERVRYMQELNIFVGVQRKRVPYADVTDMSLARDAVKLLG